MSNYLKEEKKSTCFCSNLKDGFFLHNYYLPAVVGSCCVVSIQELVHTVILLSCS